MVRTYNLVSAAFALVLSIVVIIAGSYYESPSLLAFQVLFIAGPTLLPFLILPKSGASKVISWLLIACLLAAGWSYVVYVDTRPYTGGGASFAMLFGWFTCLVAFGAAALIKAIHFKFGGDRS